MEIRGKYRKILGLAISSFLFLSQAHAYNCSQLSQALLFDEVTLAHNSPTTIPGVRDAVVVVLERDGKFLMAQRLGSVGHGQYGLIGGKREGLESLFETAQRECQEEVGVHIKEAQYIMTDFHTAPETGETFRVFTVYAKVDDSQNPVIKEPKKLANLAWFNPQSLPADTYCPTQGYFEKVNHFLRGFLGRL